MPKALMNEVDEWIKKHPEWNFLSRAEFIKMAIRNELQDDRYDIPTINHSTHHELFLLLSMVILIHNVVQKKNVLFYNKKLIFQYKSKDI